MLPRARRDELLVRDGVLTLRVTAPPVEGAANAAVCRVLAALLDVPRSRVVLERGDTGRRKRLRIRGVTVAQVETCLAFGD